MRNRTRTALTDPTSGRSLARSDAGSGEVRPGELPVRSGTFPVAPEAAGPAEEELASSDPAPGMARELTSLRRFKDDALGLLVDQLNSPLAAMMMNLDFALTELARIASHADASLARNALSESRVTGGQVFRNIANLLDIARHDEGRLQPRGVTTDATSLFARVVDPFAVEASALKVTLKTKVSLGRSIQVDPELLGRVLSTLVEGALRNTPAGGSVVLTARHGHGVAVVLSVTADGEARVPPLRGHGLRFCRAAVESHGGSIGLVGDPATATCFRIVLPHA